MSGRHIDDASGGNGANLWTAVRRNWWTMATIIPLLVAVVLVVDDLVPPRYEATTTLVLEDPRASRFFEVIEQARPSSQDSERYLADQVQIIRSNSTAELASARIGGDLSPNELRENTVVTGDADSNTVTIVVNAPDSALATRAADALAEAYVKILDERNTETIEAAVEDVATLLDNIDDEISSVTQELNSILRQDAQYQELLLQYDEALATFNELRDRRTNLEPGSIERTAINDQIAELLRDFTTWQVIFGTERGDEAVNSLLAERDALIAERSRLTTQRNAIAAASSAGLGGVVLRSPATEPEDPAGPGTPMLVALAIVLGGGLAGIAANAIEANRDDLAASRSILGELEAPMLTMLPGPDPDQQIPCRDDPASPEANRFRYAATALDIRAAAAGARSVLVAGLREGDGATTAVANLGIALAEDGLRVLVIDADLGRQSLIGALNTGQTVGLNDVLAGEVSLAAAISEVYVSGTGSLAVLGRGRKGSGAVSVRTDQTRPLIGQAAKAFDLVVIDTAPMLDSAYVATLAREVDALALVLNESTRRLEVEELLRRLDLTETPLLGYYIVARARRRRRFPSLSALAPRREPESS